MTTPLVSTPGVCEAQVRAGSAVPMALSDKLADRIVRVVVDTHLHLPDMFEITFYEPDSADGTAVEEPALQIGCTVEVLGAASGQLTSTRLIVGEVTAIEAVCEDMGVYTVVRGFDASHRLQRAKRSYVYLDQSDGSIAGQLARASGLKVGVVEFGDRSPYVPQIAETDWSFLQRRARATGYETGVEDGRFFYREAGPSLTAKLGLLPELSFGDNLLAFRPRVSSIGLTPQVEVRSWSPETSKVVVARASVEPPDTALDHRTDPKRYASQFTPSSLPAATVGDGPAPAANAYVVPDCSAGAGAGASAGTDATAQAIADRMARTHTEATGSAQGDPAIRAGALVKIQGVPNRFSGSWRITRAEHVFDENEPGGYLTRFEIGDHTDPAPAAAAPGSEAPVQGLVCGLVSDLNDPTGRGRVRVRLPWLAPDFQTDWARVVQAGAGKRGGALMLPEVGDEVLVGYEMGDARRPFVLGGLLNGQSKYNADGLGGPMTEVKGSTARRARQGFVSTSGNRLVFTDNVPETGGNATESVVQLGTKGSELALTLDQTAKSVTLQCQPGENGPSGRITIACSDNGTITIEAAKNAAVNVKAGDDGTVNIEGGRAVNVKGGTGTVTVAGAEVQIKADKQLTLKSSGPVDISGATVSLSGTPIKLN
ncbi:VgrG-related protein [Kitasatospora mediocidica]|uniref:VgrG-related protein n=1 Tax=Kitasatospora mediocidica TaxID=58352 RepID=UPI0005653135|nr:VgrG-related protein [Kitasatospora mediocidica]